MHKVSLLRLCVIVQIPGPGRGVPHKGAAPKQLRPRAPKAKGWGAVGAGGAPGPRDVAWAKVMKDTDAPGAINSWLQSIIQKAMQQGQAEQAGGQPGNTAQLDPTVEVTGQNCLE